MSPRRRFGGYRRPRRPVHLPPCPPAGRDRRQRERDRGLRGLQGHALDCGGRAGARGRGRGGQRPRARRGRQAARPQRAGGPLDCGNAGTLMRLLPGILAGHEGRFELVGDESLSTPADGADRRAAPRHGRPRGDRRRSRAGRRGGRCARARPLGAPGGERPGEVGDPPGRALRGGRPTVVIEPYADPRPHRADARGDGRPRTAEGAGSRRLAGERPAAAIHTSVPGDLSSAAPFSSRRRCSPSRSCACTAWA